MNTNSSCYINSSWLSWPTFLWTANSQDGFKLPSPTNYSLSQNNQTCAIFRTPAGHRIFPRGATGRTWTDMIFLSKDFKSFVSAYFTTVAYLIYFIFFILNQRRNAYNLKLFFYFFFEVAVPSWFLLYYITNFYICQVLILPFLFFPQKASFHDFYKPILTDASVGVIPFLKM